MNKPLKYSLIGIAGLVSLVIAGALIFAMTFDANRYKPQIERLVQEKTGRTLKLAGPLETAIWPSLGAKVSGVTLSERGSEEQFVALDSAHASVALMALLRGQVIVDKIRISGLKAQVVKQKDGRFNFSDLLEAKTEPGKEDKGARKPDEKGEGGAPVAFDIAGIDFDKAAIRYRDLGSGQELALSDVKIATGRISDRADGRLQLQGHAQGKSPELDVKLDLAADYKLELPKQAAADKIDLKLAGNAGGMKNLNLALTGSARADLEKQAASADLVMKLDETTMQAKLGLAKFSPPAYTFDVNIDRLNLDRYFPPPAKPAATAEAPKDKGAAPAKAEEDTPVDLSALKGLEAKGTVQIGSFQARGVKLANLKTEVHATGGRVEAPHSANLYEGTINGTLGLQAEGRVALKDTLTGIAIGPLLRDAAQQDKLEGKGNLALDVNTGGKSVNAMKKALAGTARVDLRDGAIKGIDIGAILRKARSALGQQQAQAQASAERTDFSAMTASFKIKNGVAHNEDLDVKAPLFRLTGRGDIDIGNSSLDYTTKAAVVATTKGQGGAEADQLSGLTVPVRLSGSFDNLKYDVNYGAVAADLAKTRVGERLKDKLQERLGGAKGGEASGQGGSTADKLRGLFGR